MQYEFTETFLDEEDYEYTLNVVVTKCSLNHSFELFNPSEPHLGGEDVFNDDIEFKCYTLSGEQAQTPEYINMKVAKHIIEEELINIPFAIVNGRTFTHE
jgi:hypothetical protein